MFGIMLSAIRRAIPGESAIPHSDYTVFISAGEASGDRLAAGLVRTLRADNPAWRICGVGSHAMQNAGFELLLDITAVSTIGITESLRMLPFALAAIIRARRLLRRVRPDIFIAVDSQGLNLILARFARRAGARVIYFIPPQNFLWNDRRHGLKTAARTDLFLNIYRKGHEFYTSLGARSVYCGHPLANTAQTGARKCRNQDKKIVLAAGARKSEIRRFIPLLAGAAHIVRMQFPNTIFITPVIGRKHEERLTQDFRRHGIDIQAVNGEDIFADADAAIVKSGTMTLDAALACCPYTVFYKISALSWFIMAKLWGIQKKLHSISIPNILSGKELAREFLQSDARPAQLAEEILRFLYDKQKTARRIRALKAFRRSLLQERPAPGDCYTIASRAIAKFSSKKEGG
ncbi:MAG: lipid-A-disaccharide synthase [Spirochaetota bacterium]|jgi:lipid-A-disaccharide synthase|nr:lipid-A-disaccharide synthase [Spirochaetota bacterium]